MNRNWRSKEGAALDNHSLDIDSGVFCGVSTAARDVVINNQAGGNKQEHGQEFVSHGQPAYHARSTRQIPDYQNRQRRISALPFTMNGYVSVIFFVFWTTDIFLA